MLRALVLMTALLSAPAFAVFQCGATQDVCQCGANNPYPCCDNGGNCTWFAWHNACCNLAVGLPSWGNAKQWTGNAQANGNYSVHGSPVTNAVSCRDIGTYGHVAFVSSLNGGSSITVKEQNCWGGYGAFTTNYNASYFTGGFITPAGQVQCNPGDAQQRSCGNCGTQSRGCNTGGQWDGWGACSSEGVCTPGAEDTKSCGDCGVSKRSCTASCQWNAYAACENAPGAEALDAGTCSTGKLGACSVGTKRCTAGQFTCEDATAPTTETCDGIDNDCDGLTDGPQCQVAVGAPPSVERPATLGNPDVTKMTLSNVGCSSVGGFGLFLLPLLLRRRAGSG